MLQKKRKLTDINIWALAFVDKGANKRRFFLTKRDEKFQLAYKSTKLPETEKEAATVLKNQMEDPRMEEIKKMSQVAIDTLKSCIAQLEKAQSKEDVNSALGLLKALAEKYPEAYPEPAAKTTKEAVDKVAEQIEKSSEIGAEIKKAAKENLDDLRGNLGFIAKRALPEQIAPEAVGLALAEAVGKELTAALT